jgi:hypothetical protein
VRSQILSVLAACYLLLPQPGHTQDIWVSASEWDGFAQRDGSGLYFDVLKAVFPNDTLHFEPTSFKVAIDLFNKQKADMVLAVYHSEVSDAIYSKWILDTDDAVTGYYLLDSFTTPPRIDEYIKVGWLEGYGFRQFFPKVQDVYLVETRDAGFRMLKKKRLDVFFDYLGNNLHQDEKVFGHFEAHPGGYLYIAFQNNSKGKKLAKIYNQRMTKLKREGTLKKIYKERYVKSGIKDFSL